MRYESIQAFPSRLLDDVLCADEGEPFAFIRGEHEPLDEERARLILAIMETVRLWGTEERALLKEIASKVDALAETCTTISNYLGVAKDGQYGIKIVPIETLNEAFTLKRPIFAVVEHAEGVVTATYYDCELFGEGESEFEALDDLKQCVVEYFLQLRESSEALGPLPAKHLAILSELISEK